MVGISPFCFYSTALVLWLNLALVKIDVFQNSGARLDGNNLLLLQIRYVHASLIGTRK